MLPNTPSVFFGEQLDPISPMPGPRDEKAGPIIKQLALEFGKRNYYFLFGDGNVSLLQNHGIKLEVKNERGD